MLLYVHYERPIPGHVLSTIHMDTSIESRKRPVGDLPKDDINYHEIHWSRSRRTVAGATSLIEFAVWKKPLRIIKSHIDLTTGRRRYRDEMLGLITINLSYVG